MKALILGLLTVCAVIRGLPTQDIKGWRGITPLHSKREDVERLLGKPKSLNKYLSSYELDDQVVSIMYADGPPCGTSAVDEWRVPSDTVVSIHVSPKRELRFTDVKINKSEYRETVDIRVKDLFYYTNQEEGIKYTVQKTDEVPTGVVIEITYMPAARDYNLHCGGTTSGTSDDRSFYPPLDKYGNVPPDNERARLDNLAIQLQQQTDLKAFIIFYAASCGHTEIEGARNHAESARRYMIRKSGINPERIAIINGGSRREFIIELYLIPHYAPSPFPASTSIPCQRSF